MDASTRNALVTGANKGLGLEVARRLGEAGLRVWLGARDAQAGEEAAARLREGGADVRPIRIDVLDTDSIAAAAARIEAEDGRLDVLVNNAGVNDMARDGAPGKAQIEAVRAIFDVNFFGALAVTQAMLPLLRRSTAGRIVNVSSGLGSLAHNGDPAWPAAATKRIGYSASKAALNMLTVQLAAELIETGIKVNAANPGFTSTDLTGHRGGQSIPDGAAAAVRLALIPDDGPTGGFFDAAGPEPW